MGFARLAESSIRKIRGKDEKEKLGALEKILASSIGGAIATWNQPIEVVRVEVSALIDLRLCFVLIFIGIYCNCRCNLWRRARLLTDLRS